MKNKFKDFVNNANKEKKNAILIFSGLLALCYLYGDIKVSNISFSFLEVIKVLAIFFIYCTAFTFINYLLKQDYLIKKSSFLNKQPVLFIIFLICWMPHLLVKYPIAFWYDEYIELLQGLGYETLSSHFPVFYTYELTFFYKIGELFGDHNFSMFIFGLIHCMIMALIFSYTIKTLYLFNIKKWLLIVYTLFFCFCPYISGSIGTTTKDVYYSSYIVLFCLQLYIYVYKNESFKINNLLLTIFSSLALTLLRKNGIYVVIISMFVIIVLEFTKKNYRKTFVILFIVIICITSSKIINSMNVKNKGSVAEALSIPFQQTARFVTYHSELVTDDEKNVLDKFFPYDSLSKLYDEDLSDPVKFSFKREATDDIYEYFEVWLKQFFKSPLTYFDATIRQNIYLVYPKINIYKYNVECNGGVLDGKDQSQGLVQSPLWLKNNIQKLYWSGMEMLHEIPIFQLINNMSIFVILFIYSIIVSANSQNRKAMITCVPIIVSLLIVIASPTVRTHPRYVYPIIYSFPIWISMLLD